MTDQNFEVPFLLVLDFSSIEVVAVLASLDQDFSMTATVAAAVVHADHLSLVAPTLQVQHHLRLLTMLEILGFKLLGLLLI